MKWDWNECEFGCYLKELLEIRYNANQRIAENTIAIKLDERIVSEINDRIVAIQEQSNSARIAELKAALSEADKQVASNEMALEVSQANRNEILEELATLEK